MGSFDLNLFVSDIIIGVRLSFFGPRHLTLGPNPRGQFCVLKEKRKSASLEPLTGHLTFVIGKL